MRTFIKLLIRIIDPMLLGKSGNWFSMRYARIKSELRKERFSTHKRDSKDCFYYHVHGAGDLEISKEAKTFTGGVENGFHIGVEWGEYGFAGGVMSKEDAISLADHIYLQVENAFKP